MQINEVQPGVECECYVNGRPIRVKIVSILPFARGVKIIFVDARKPGRKMERYSEHDFRPVQ